MNLLSSTPDQRVFLVGYGCTLVHIANSSLETNRQYAVCSARWKSPQNRMEVIQRRGEEECIRGVIDDDTWNGFRAKARRGAALLSPGLSNTTFHSALALNGVPIVKAVLLEAAPTAISVDRSRHVLALAV